MAAAAASSSSAAPPPQTEVMASCSSAGRYREGTRVLLTSGTRRGANESYVWLKADVYRIEETSKGSLLFMREVGGREEFKQVVPHRTSVPINTNPQPPVVWDFSKKAPAHFSDDLLASVFSFMTPRELSTIIPPTRTTAPDKITLLYKQPRRQKPIRTKFRCRLSSVGGHTTTPSPLSAMASSSALPWPNFGPLCAGAAFGSSNGETTAASKEAPADVELPGVPSVSSLSGGLSLSGISTGEGGLWSPAAAGSSGAATPAPKPRTRAKRVSAARPVASITTGPATTTTTQTHGGSAAAPAEAPSTAQSTTTAASGPFDIGKASTRGGGNLFGGGAASGGDSLFGRVGSTGSRLSGTGTRTGRIFGQTPGSVLGGSIFGGTGVAASSVSSGAPFSTGDSLSGGAALRSGQQRPDGAAQSSPSLIHTAALHQQTLIAIDSSTDADRQFWESMTPEEAFQLGKRLPNLTALRMVQPRSDRLWGLDRMICVVEGHAAGRWEACEKEGQHHIAKGSLETIHFTPTSSTSSVKQPRPPIAPSFAPPPTLHALRTVTGVARQHRVLADRSWHMPALEYVDQEGWDAETLGRFISSSSSLKEVGGRRRSWEEWAGLFENLPIAFDGQPGPLRHLQTIGGIGSGRGGTLDQYRQGARGLQAVLTSRGCHKALTRLDVRIPPFQDHDSLSALLAVDGFISTCCVSPDVPLNVQVTRPGSFELSLFYADAFPPRPSPFIKTAIQEAARQARYVTYTISQHDITHPVYSPSQTAVEIAKTLSFDKAKEVYVSSAYGFVLPPPGTPSPIPAVINDMQPFPVAEELHIRSAFGGALGRLLGQKMPKMPMRVQVVWFAAAVSAEDRIAVLEALGEEREVDSVAVGDEEEPVSLTQGGAFDGWRSQGLPSLRSVDMYLLVPHDLEDAVAAELIRDGLSTILTAGLRGLRRVELHLQTIGGIEYDDDDETPEQYREGARRLQDVLTSRGCHKSLTRLDVRIPPFQDHDSLSALLAVDGFINTCCVSPDVPLNVQVTRPGSFELSLFYADAFPPRPSPFIKTAIQEAAKQARYVTYTISQHDITHPVYSPSQTAVEIAKTLSFDKTKEVYVSSAYGFVLPPPGTPSPIPAVINDMQPFPVAEELHIRSAFGGAPGRLLGQEMPKMPMRVQVVWFGAAVSAEDRIAVVEALGQEREVDSVAVGDEEPVSLTQGGAFDGWRSQGLPSLRSVDMYLLVPHELEDAVAAELIRYGLSAILTAGLRGLRRVELWLEGEANDSILTAIRQLLPNGTEIDDFTINTRRTLVEATRRY
ncbi:unnamed protein product [Vitrella brassicaformis CCMP3155]|uniref:Uncharacterized protein n=1 Tax=Vitrella brassicaformis (strain CCMP3155) TaxID=1169540 RepID=A0A0G4EDI6_VITBC|nr:unnamed protein product [Vitrella brassicaformis CCMP3155]|eukprot:CEL93421.1 unnamed protein product [Vitrella brassicaformis CCMP3155]